MKEKVFAFLKTVPFGKVVTYGQIARVIGNPNAARAVGNILHQNPEPAVNPCYRVVNHKGELSDHFAFGGKEAQQMLLENEGILVQDGRVDLNQYGWKTSFGP